MSSEMHFCTGTAGDADAGHPRPRQLPADIHGFVNRTRQLEQLNAILIHEGGARLAVSVGVIAGMPGAGKTSLALRWAHQVKDHFPDGQLYINLRGFDSGDPVDAYEALRRFLIALGASADSVPHNLDDAAAHYRSVLADRRVLILLDNAASMEQVSPLLPASEGCLVIVTSRRALPGLAVQHGAERLELDKLPENEAVALLRAVTTGYRSEEDDSDEKLAQLARLCAGLPLALRIAAERAASNPYMRLDDIIDELRDESALWDALSSEDGPESDAVRTVFSWSYRALPQPAARLFRLLGLHPGPEISLGAAAALAGVARRIARQQLNTLVNVHFLKQTAPDRYEFHDLLRAFATGLVRDEEPEDEQEEALQRMFDWYLHSADAAQSWIEPAEDHMPLAPPVEGSLPSVFDDHDAATDWAELEHSNMERAVRAAAASQRDELVWQLLAVWWNAQSPSAFAVDWMGVAPLGLEAAERLGNRSAEALLLLDLGMARAWTNSQAEARECYERALRLYHELDDRDGEAQALNLLGLICLRTRQLEDAARYFEEALDVFRDLGLAHWQATAQSNLATVYYNAGRLEDAADAGQRALDAHRSRDNKRGEGNILRLLSCVQREQGDTESALCSAESAMDLALEIRDHALEGYWLLALGDAQLAAGRFGDAYDSYHRSATLNGRLGNRSREAMAWHGVGETYLRRPVSTPTEAVHFHRRAAATHRELGDAWHEALSREGQAAALLAEGSSEEARAEWAEAMRLLAEFDDPRAVATRERIAQKLESIG